jgi:nitroimidazol reductase NimA-like FMN-containing flavoprotein (pyridoxamine 5'-phosphate oxidase superfamily)
MSAQRFELPDWESFEHLRETAIGRMCIIDNGFPLAIPVNFRVAGRLDDYTIVIRTAPQTMLGRYEGAASLEVDHIDIHAGQAWSVFVRGNVRRVVGNHELPDPRPLLDEGRYQWMTLQPSAMSGRRFNVKASTDNYFVEWQFA